MSASVALDNRQVIEKALIVLVGFLVSGALGFLRIAVVGAQFGTGAANDAFAAAQQIPETIFVLVAGGALGSSFIPVYARVREIDPAQAWRLASAVMSLSAAAAAVFGLLVSLFAPQFVSILLYPDRPPEQQQLMIEMVRLMMITPFIFSISGLIMGILQSHAAFWLPAIALSMNNIGIIIGALFIAPILPAHADVGQVGNLNVLGLAYGAVLSAALHLLVQLPGLFKLRARLRPLLSFGIPGVLDVMRLMGPRVLGLAVVQINFHVNIRLANTMTEGSVVAIKYAFMLAFFVLGMIGQSQGSAVFPTLAALRAAGNYEGFKDRLARAMRNVLYLSFPASAFLIVLGEPIVSILQRGQFTAESTQAVAWALSFYAIGLAGFALLEVLSARLLRAGGHLDTGHGGPRRHAQQHRAQPGLHPIHRRSGQARARRIRRSRFGQRRDHHCRSAGPLVAVAQATGRGRHDARYPRPPDYHQRWWQPAGIISDGLRPAALVKCVAGRRLAIGAGQRPAGRANILRRRLSLRLE